MPSVLCLSVESVAPPYTTAKVPKVASTIASKRLGSHGSLNRKTLIIYAKKALVFPMAFGYKSNEMDGFFISISPESSPVKSVMLIERTQVSTINAKERALTMLMTLM